MDGPHGQGLVQLANNMLVQLHCPLRVNHWADINANIFVTLFEGLCCESLPDVIRHPRCREDEVHNCQSVIDTLSLDVLNTSLSHITGEEVVDGSMVAIANLLEVFSGLLEYIVDRIGSDVSTDNDERLSLGGRHDDLDPDRVTSDLIDDVLERELGRNFRLNGSDSRKGINGHKSSTQEKDRSWMNGSSKIGNSTDDLIALGNVDSSWTSQNHRSPDKTEDLIALGDINGNSPPSKGPRNPYINGRSNTAPSRTTPPDSQRDLHGLDPVRREEIDNIAASLERLNAGRDEDKSGSLGSGGVTSVPPATSTQGQQALHDLSLSSSVTFPKEPASQIAGQFDNLGVRPRAESDRMSASLPLGRASDGSKSGTQHTYTHHLYHHYGDRDPMASSLPATSTFKDLPPSGRRTGTKSPPAGQGSASAPTVLLDSSGKPVTAASGSINKTSSQPYQTLQTLMKDTVEISRQAVSASPLRERSGPTVSANPQRDRPVVKEPRVDNVQPAKDRPQTATIGTSPGLDTGERRYVEMSSDLRSALQDVTSDPSRPLTSVLTSTAGRSRSADVKGNLRQTNSVYGRDNSKGISSPCKKRPGKNVSFYLASKSLSSSESSLDRARKTKSRRSAPLKSPPPRKPSVKSSVPSPASPMDTSQDTSPAPEAPYHNQPVRTFHDYLLKYYGRGTLRPEGSPGRHSDGESDGFDSDGGVDYMARGNGNDSSRDGDVSTLSAELEEYRKMLMKKSKTVRFEDILDDSAPGRMGGLRRKLKKEDQKTRYKAAFIDKLYEEELTDFEGEMADRLKKHQDQAKEIETMYKKSILKEPKTKYRPVKKYSSSVGAAVLRNRGRKRSHSTLGRKRKRSHSASPSVGRKTPLHITDHEILPWLLEEFPYLHLSKETLHELWNKSSQQIEILSKAEREHKRKKSKAQSQIEEAERKQSVLTNIMKKELSHNQRMRDMKARQRQTATVKATIRDRRQQSSRSRKYYEEYQVRMRSKMLKKRSREEQLFKKLFNEGLTIQKDRIRELRGYTREQRQERARKQQDELDSLENYYKDQFAMLSETISKERGDLEVREKAQGKVLATMKRELRKKMEHEISDLQEQMYRDEDDLYYRDLDAQKLRQQLHLARYQAAV